MAEVIYALCALTTVAAFVLLWRGWRATGARLLFWSGLCFLLLAVSNVLLVFDKLVFPHIDFGPWRLVSGFAAMAVLLFGLVWEEQ
jgi:hypothetical protein